MILECLKQGILNKIISKSNSTINLVNNLYFALVFNFFMTYKTNNWTIKDFNTLKKLVKESLIKNPQKLLDKFTTEIKSYQKKNSLK